MGRPPLWQGNLIRQNLQIRYYYKRVTGGLQIVHLHGRSHSSYRPTVAAFTSPDPPYRVGLPGPRCPYTKLSIIARLGWKFRFSGCGDSKLGTRAERVFERYNVLGCSVHAIRVICSAQDVARHCTVVQSFFLPSAVLIIQVWITGIRRIINPLRHGLRNPANSIKQTAECRCYFTRMQ